MYHQIIFFHLPLIYSIYFFLFLGKTTFSKVLNKILDKVFKKHFYC